MTLQVLEVGQEKSRVIIIDDFMLKPQAAIDLAASLAPFSAIDNHYYPGLRRLIHPEETEAFAYVDGACRSIAPLMQEVFGVEKFQITEAGFSIVTLSPERTQLIQRVPHFDTLDAGHFALLHYLSPTPKGGTGFYRHRRTGFERLNAERFPAYQAALDLDLKQYRAPPEKYILGSSDSFEQIHVVEGVFNRMVIYQGALFHSGQIPEDFDFNPDPRKGRLTGNIFVGAR